ETRYPLRSQRRRKDNSNATATYWLLFGRLSGALVTGTQVER
ncbi:4465_t:CDS:1, partial [Ambispora leptoticha]